MPISPIRRLALAATLLALGAMPANAGVRPAPLASASPLVRVAGTVTCPDRYSYSGEMDDICYRRHGDGKISANGKIVCPKGSDFVAADDNEGNGGCFSYREPVRARGEVNEETDAASEEGDGTSLKCHFDTGPNRGKTVDFTGFPGAIPAPIGSPCHAYGATGVTVR